MRARVIKDPEAYQAPEEAAEFLRALAAKVGEARHHVRISVQITYAFPEEIAAAVARLARKES